jgi:hypothetical protein
MLDNSKGALAETMRRELAGVLRAAPQPGVDIGQVQDDLELVGLAFSGGGIRSATFNLGILQGLEKMGLLEFVDYLSTVSGGGYIGSWYLACLKEGLRSEADRGPAVSHLRRFSRYLSPQAGLFSADAWTIAMVWLRNTLLLQTMLVSLFAVVLLAPRFFELWFLTFSETWTTAAAVLIFGWTVFQAMNRLAKMSDAEATVTAVESTDTQGSVQVLIVVPMIVAGACFSSALWRSLDAARPWWCFVAGLIVGVATWLTARQALLKSIRNQLRWLCGVAAVGILCGALFGGLTYALAMVYGSWAPEFRPDGQWLAGVFGAPAILISLSLCVVLQIGLLGRAMDDAMREWWSRLGAFLAIYSAAALVVGAAAIYGPLLCSLLLSNRFWHWIGGSVTLGGVATTLGGVLAARSRDTGGNATDKDKSPFKEFLAQAAPYVFITGLIIAVSASAQYLLAGQVVMTKDHWAALDDTLEGDRARLWWGLAISSAVLALLAWRIDINETSMNLFYRNRLVRCYLGAARQTLKKRHPNLFTGFDFADDFGLAGLRPQRGYVGPVPIVNTALNLTGGDNAALEERRAASFFFTPYGTGSDPTGVVETEDVGKFSQGIHIGSCIATSGAAASPNMGYHTSAPVAFLMTFLNVRLGLWLRSPRLLPAKGSKQSARWGLWYLLKELFATADVKDNYIYLSDGGHFENLGVYELVRRRCRYIIVGDAEQDGNLVMEALGGLVRKCRIDFGVEIEIDTSQIRQVDLQGRSRTHCSVGRIFYKNPDQVGYLIYLKSSLTGDERSDILQYKAQNPAFPHESTGNQFFGESPFESYRALGEHIVMQAFGGGSSPFQLKRSDLEALMQTIRDTWDPPSPFTEGRFAHHAEQVSYLWHELRKAGLDQVLDQELFPGWRKDVEETSYQTIRQGLYLCQTILQLMQNVYLDLHLDTEWEHPDNKGWKALFVRWAESPTLREAYGLSASTFGDRFRQFCHQRLGLTHKRE